MLVQFAFDVQQQQQRTKNKDTPAATDVPQPLSLPIATLLPQQVCYTQTKQLGYKQLWLLFGDEFVAADGDGLPAWLLQLRASANTLLAARPTVMSLASPSVALADQIDAAERNVDVAAALATRDGALVFVSYGISRLAQAVAGNYVDGDARLYQLEDEFEALVNFSQRLHANVVLLQRPNPLCNGVRVDPRLLLCSPAQTQAYLNFPSMRSLQLHDALYNQVLRLYASLCIRNAPFFSLINSDAALCTTSLALAPTLSDSSFADCLSYGGKGQMQLAKLVWECIQ
jgi:hypothetical protein